MHVHTFVTRTRIVIRGRMDEGKKEDKNGDKSREAGDKVKDDI